MLIITLTSALENAGADPQVVADLGTASDCDALVFGLIRGLDDFLAEVPPVDEEDAGTSARELLRWALTSTVPGHYKPCSTHLAGGPLLDSATWVSSTSPRRGWLGI